MLPPSPPSLLVFALLHGAPAPQQSSTAACEGLQRIELALAPTTTAREICVSPGLMTSFVFDVRAEVELQDEVRFQEVARGLGTISFLPPRDMMPGERLRLTANLLRAGDTQELVTFTLVARSGQATHQVEVYHDKRSRESYQHEVAQERAKVHQLREQLEQMRTRLAQSEGLRALIASKALTHLGIQARVLTGTQSRHSEGTLSFVSGASYRTNLGVTAELWLMNSGSEPRNVLHASLVDATGKELHSMKPWQEKPIAPGAAGLLIAELDAQRQVAQGEFTLVLKDDGGHVLQFRGVSFPD